MTEQPPNRAERAPERVARHLHEAIDAVTTPPEPCSHPNASSCGELRVGANAVREGLAFLIEQSPS